MGIRIDIDWKFASPILQKATGILTIRHLIPFGENSIDNILLQCECFIEQGSVGFKSIDNKGVSCKIFKVFEEQINCMIRSFFKGMILDMRDFHWVDETLDESIDIDDWLHKQEKVKGLS